MSKRIVLIILAITTLTIVGLSFFVHSTSGKETSSVTNPAYREYISAYTSGFVSVQSKITIVLTSETTQDVKIGEVVDNTLFDFSPSIAGKITWLDKRTIEFKPDQLLLSGKKYACSFDLGQVLSVPSDFNAFEFNFSTINQAFDFTIDTYKSDSEGNSLQVFGTLNTADYAENGNVEKTLLGYHNDNALKIDWTHETPTVHHFIISGVNLISKKSELIIDYNGTPIDAKESGKKEIQLPASNEFSLIHVKVVNEPEQYVSLQFSNLVDKNQNLEGLISIDKLTPLNFLIEDNEIKVYTPERIDGTKSLTILPQIKNKQGKQLTDVFGIQKELVFEDLKPAVRLVGKGVILPSSNGLIFPFEAVNLNAVDIKIVKIYETNILQFLQANNLDGSNELMRVGKVVVKKKINLNSLGSVSQNKWTKYALDLGTLISAEPGAIYNVKINFKKNYSIYDCTSDTASSSSTNEVSDIEENEADADDEKDWDYYSYYSDYEDGYYYDYNYSERNNPCSQSYYTYGRSVNSNVLASNIGLIVKRGNDGQMQVICADLVTTKPLSGVEIKAYDYQQQLLKKASTNAEGIAELTLSKKPFVIVAQKAHEKTYLKLVDGNSLSLSSFDVQGTETQKGMKGFIYGERGVWRPGDTLFLSFILENKNKTFPDNYPAAIELLNPMGQAVQRLTTTNHVNGFYKFILKTESNAITGNYMAKVKVGGATFTKNVRIESIMPNRLKINLDFKNDKLYSDNLALNSPLYVNWLHGAPGRNLETKIDLSLSQTTTEFKGYNGYTFDNPAQSFYSETQTVFTGRTNDQGLVNVTGELSNAKNAPGFLTANFTVRAFEEGGAFSTDRFNVTLSPYSHYVGIKVPEPSKNETWLETDKDHTIQVATVDEHGVATSRSNLEVKVYKIDWRWWWDNYNEDLSSYIGSTYHQPISTELVSTSNGKGNFKLRINQPEWGRYLVYVKDNESGHACGKIVYIDWPSWAGKSPKGNEGAAMLNVSTDKQEYKVGETAKVIIPSAKNGKVYLSIENGSRVLSTHIVDTKEGNTEYNIPITKDMTPNVYVYAHLIQPHAQSINDLPIRLYGIASISVKDENTILKPVIQTTSVWKPEQTATVKVSEQNGKEMAYTLAVVDEGLLDITRFKTPDPWNAFYAKEALGVKTWDIYDQVIGAYGNSLSRILSIGGDGELDAKPENSALRFKPMVRYVGPFILKKGEIATHKIDVPQYVGSVRIMVVAGNNGAYGNAEKAVPVRKPVMILSTLPRVLGPGEEVDLPITVFAMEKKVKDVAVQITTDKFITAMDGSSKTVSFNDVGDKVITFHLKIKDALGVSKLKIKATGAGEIANETIEIAVRANNPKVTDVQETVANNSGVIKLNYTPLGIQGTNKAYLELSTLPAINLGQRLNYLMEYPHGCVEQTTSSVFAALYLNAIMELDTVQKKVIDRNIKAAIQRLKTFQTVSGGLSYWPGLNTADDWGTSYAGHFLLEAQEKGYSLPYGLLDHWTKYQKQKAQNYVPNKNTAYYGEDLTQAYRLYTLALAKSPELGAMNRMKENKNLSLEAKWRLAAAYAIIGQQEVAKKLVYTVGKNAAAHNDMYYTYGSIERDDAMILETMILLKDQTQAFTKVKNIAAKLGKNDDWMSTQTTAYCLLSISKYAKQYAVNGTSNVEYTIANETVSLKNVKLSYKLIELKNANTSQSISVKNTGSGSVFVRLVKSGIPVAGKETSKASNLSLAINYKTLSGTTIDVTKLEQGTDFVADITVKNPGYNGPYRNMAITEIFASGWEIRNQRLDNINYLKGDLPTYQDIRDDRVLTYFDIAASSTKNFKVLLNAAYVGKFYLPSTTCEAMYDNTVYAREAGKWVSVVKAGLYQ